MMFQLRNPFGGKVIEGGSIVDSVAKDERIGLSNKFVIIVMDQKEDIRNELRVLTFG